MTYSKHNKTFIIRLEKGEQLVASLTDFVKTNKIQGAWISGLGGSQSAEIGFYHLKDKVYGWKVYHQLLEITSLQGNVSWVDSSVAGQAPEPKLHIHGSFSDEQMQAFGGHVKELTVGGTCEIKLDVLDTPLKRSHDEEIGLDLLDL